MVIAVTPDNRYLIYAPREYGQIEIVDFETMNPVRTIGQESTRKVTLLAFPDNRHVLVRERDPYNMEGYWLTIFNVISGEQVARSRGLVDAYDPMITSDGRRIVCAFYGRMKVGIWDWQTNERGETIIDRTSEKQHCFVRAMMPDGNRVAIAFYPALNWSKERHYKRLLYLGIWNLSTSEFTTTFKGYEHCAALSDNRRLLAIAGQIFTRLIILNIETGRAEHKLNKGAGRPGNHFWVTPDGHEAIAMFEGLFDRYELRLGVWELPTGKFQYEVPLKAYPHKIILTPDGRYLVKWPGNQRWDLQKRELIVLPYPAI
jgi:hypothetical protein